MINKIKTKKAFTLAELTVALSIVGVLAAIVIPAVHNMAPNKEMIMFKKAYGEFTRISSEMVNNDDLYPESYDGQQEGFSATSSVTFRGVTASGSTKFCKLFSAHASIKETISTCNFITNDGVQWILPYFYSDDSDNAYKTVTIDVNGPDVGPNSSSNSNLDRDTFSFTMNKYGRIKIEDTLTKKYLTETDMSKSLEEVLSTP